MNFWQNFRFDRTSFWLGFLAASLLIWLLGRMRPTFERIRNRLAIQRQTSRSSKLMGDEIRLANAMLSRAQGWHIAADLFSLDEVVIPPQVLLPPPPPEIDPDNIQVFDITNWVIPYMPDWPQMASFYRAPSVSLNQALQGSANLVVVGEAGSGKTVALAHLVSQMAQSSSELGVLEEYTPLMLHAADLPLPKGEMQAYEVLIAALSPYIPAKLFARLPKVLPTLLEQGRVLLVLDGLDELSPSHFDMVTSYLEGLLEAYPGLRLVAAANPNYLGKLPALGCEPVALVSWDTDKRAEFLARWGALWSRFVAQPGEMTSDPMLIHGWLLNNTNLLTPLELTLKVWGAYAGDLIGPDRLDSIESYLRRMLYHQPSENRTAFEQLCAQMTLAMQPVVHYTHADQWLAGKTVIDPIPDEEDKENRGAQQTVSAPTGALQELISSGLISQRPAERVNITHPVICGYLASQSLTHTAIGEQLLTQPDWSGQHIALHYLAAHDSQSPWTREMLIDESAEPLLNSLLLAARWLRDAPDKADWASNVMRVLASSLQKITVSVSVKARIVSALVTSGNPGVPVLMRQMLSAPPVEIRQLAALGSGMLRDPKSVEELNKLIDDPSPFVHQAAILGLVAIGDKIALENVAVALLQGDEGLRQAAAEGLANHPEEGHPTLEEASKIDDPAVRRAAVFGLRRVNKPWAIEILEKMRSIDDQWMVQDAASQALDSIERPDSRLPQRHPPLTETPWLIAFAAKRGIGVAPGKPAQELLYQALQEGEEIESLSAMYYLANYGDESSILPLYQVYFSNIGEIRETAINTLARLYASGIDLPPPVKYGLK